MSKKDRPESTQQDALNRVADGIEDVKRLLIFALTRNGASQGEIANALGVAQSSISKLLSHRKAKAK